MLDTVSSNPCHRQRLGLQFDVRLVWFQPECINRFMNWLSLEIKHTHTGVGLVAAGLLRVERPLRSRRKDSLNVFLNDFRLDSVSPAPVKSV
jgi:hypothetical protein